MPNYMKLLDSIASKDTDNKSPEIVQRFFLPGIDNWSPGTATTEWQADDILLGPTGLFGGYIAMVSDTMASHATYSLMEPHEWMATKSIKVDFMRPIRDGRIHVQAKATRDCELVRVEIVYTRSDGAIAYIAFVEQIIKSTKNEAVINHEWNKSV